MLSWCQPLNGQGQRGRLVINNGQVAILQISHQHMLANQL